MSNSRGLYWCFTTNNYTDDNVKLCTELTDTNNNVCYIIYGKETAGNDNQTPHLQGFLAFSKRLRFGQVKKVLPAGSHIELAKAPPEAIEYCKKEGDWFESGTVPIFKKGAGKRSDIDKFCDDVKSHEFTRAELIDRNRSVFFRYHNYAKEYMRDNRKPDEASTEQLYAWQQKLHDELRKDPDKRTIIFVVDTVGNTGKSWFSRQYQARYPDENTQIIIPGKKADMAYILCDSPRVVLFDAPRSKQGEFIQYDFLEEVKNGMVFSPKYFSDIKSFKSPHVVVMMNEMPDKEKLSADRYKIMELNQFSCLPASNTSNTDESN